MSPACWLCGATQAELLVTLHERPGYETDFGFAPYQRSIYRCGNCGVYFNIHQHLTPDFYQGTYNQATYQQQLAEKYDRIRALPFEKSDNKQRVQRIVAFFAPRSDLSVLDIGSGLSVFGGELQSHGFRCYCLDPDPRAVEHALTYAGLAGGFAGTLETFASDQHFDLITLNKVLEHVDSPIGMLRGAAAWLKPGGVIYIEVPDGEGAAKAGGIIEQEEFYLEHFTVYTPESLAYLVEGAGLKNLSIAAIHEPSNKYTLYAFLEQGKASTV
jgi:2-polyprenyl-3-methyl-5-hydroxy-6-metoxy-1,4-benzoquinol methylase